MLSRRPTIAQQPRWNIGTQSIVFWFPILLIGRLAVWLVAALLHDFGLIGPPAKLHLEELLHILRTVDPDAAVHEAKDATPLTLISIFPKIPPSKKEGIEL